jgi:hypothetical protein
VTPTLFLKADAKFAADVLVESGVVIFSTGIELFNGPETVQQHETAGPPHRRLQPDFCTL